MFVSRKSQLNQMFLLQTELGRDVCGPSLCRMCVCVCVRIGSYAPPMCPEQSEGRMHMFQMTEKGPAPVTHTFFGPFV